MSRQEHLNWVQPQWWVGLALNKHERLDVFISRDQLITAWAAATASPKPNIKLLNDQLKSWCSELGARRWVREPYGENGTEVARRLAKAPKQILQQPEIWDHVCDVLADYGDPLARRSAQYDEIIRAHRPKDLPTVWNDIMRGWERNQVCRAARDTMIQSCKVLETKDSADQFIDNPVLFSNIISAAAGQEYNKQLIDFMSRTSEDEGLTATKRRALDLQPLVEELLQETSDELKEVYGEPDWLPRQPTSEEIAEVADQLQDFLNRRPEIYRGDSFRLRGDGRTLPGFADNDIAQSDAVATAWERTRRDLLKFKVEGTPITDDWMGRIFTTKLKDAIKELRRGAIRHRNRFVLETHAVGSDDDTVAESEVGTVDSEAERQRVDLQRLFAAAHKALAARNVEKLDAVGPVNELNGAECWEKSMALQILSSDAFALSDRNVSSISGLFEPTGMRSTLNHFITTNEPDNRLLQKPDNSVRLVVALLKWSVSQIIEDDDIPKIGILGGRTKSETWSEKMNRLVADVRTSREASDTTSVWREK